MESQHVRERTAQDRAPARGLRLGQYFGVELRADISLLIIFTLIATNLGLGAFAMLHPDWGPLRVWSMAVLAAVLFFVSVALHELSHAVVGRRFGIPVRRITLFIFGGMAHADREPPSPRSEFWMAIAGPLMSFAIAMVAAVTGAALLGDALAQYRGDPLQVMRDAGPLPTLLLWLAPVNLILGVFNLVPGFPLDGGRVLRAILWWLMRDLQRATFWAARVGQAFAWLLMGTGLIMLFGYALPGLQGGLFQGIWLILIGWFLNNAARMSFTQLVITETLSQVSVRDVMRSHVTTVAPYLTLTSLMHDYFMNTDQATFPVTQGTQVIGMVRRADVEIVPQARWDGACVRDVMIPAADLHMVSPDDDAMLALRELSEQDSLPVIQDRQLVGLTQKEDILRWLALHRPRVV